MKWKSSGSDFIQPEPGTYVARCIRLVDLGTQYGEYQGKPTANRQVFISWELPNDLIPSGDHEGEPFVVSKFYTASLNEKANLRRDLVAWRGKEFTEEELRGFAAKNILGQPCLLGLTETEGKKIRVTTVAALPRGTEVPNAVNELTYFSLDPEEFDANVFDGLTDGLKNLVSSSPEYRALGDDDNDIPF